MDSTRLYFDTSHANMLFMGHGDHLFRGAARSVLNMEETSKRRPFFSSTEDLFDEEYYDEQSPEKKRRLTPEQVHMLEKSFEAENKLEPERKSQLAKKLGLQPRQVAVWFQNRRARWKTKQLERDYDLLKSSYDSLLSEFESVVKDNKKLKSEVECLTEKLQDKELNKEPDSGEKSELLLVDVIRVKVEDRLSSGSGGSAVVDEDGPQLVDSGDSFFGNDDDYPATCMGPLDGIQSEEDDGSDDGRSYFSGVFGTVELPPQEEEGEGEALGWWVWS